jgi:1-acyl-sn-glycerol-3-phosphate acyltransferase
MIDWYVRKRVVGGEVFDGLAHPVIFVANHSSHLDTPTILRALPSKWRRRTAVAAAADYFYDTRWKAAGVALLFNTVPLGRKGGGLGNGATDHVDRILEEGWNLVMFPEGTRSRDGDVGKVHSGAAVIAAQHQIPIVPIYLSGAHEAMPPGQNWPQRKPGPFLSRRHEIEVRFGDPIQPHGTDEARDVMDRVREFWVGEGLAPVPPPARARERRFERAPAPRTMVERGPNGIGPATAPVPPEAPETRRSGTTVS